VLAVTDTTTRTVRLDGHPVVTGPHDHLASETARLAGLTWRHFSATRLAPTIGAEVSGLDLRVDLPDEVIDEIRQGLHDYKVLFFRDQPLTAAEHTAFAQRFGELELHPFIPSNTTQPELVRFEKNEQIGGYENIWHHDVTWRECPSMGAILHAGAVPDVGGDTLFSDMYAAYECLDDDTRTEIEDMWAVHDFTATFGQSMSDEQRTEMQARYPAVRHPVVCTHPATERRHLYVNRPFVARIEGLEPSASLELLDRLCRQVDYPEHQCRFRWSPNTVAFWDNRAVQHYAASDYWPAERVMERASIVGNRPFK
jgi:taurine dioxygenase